MERGWSGLGLEGEAEVLGHGLIDSVRDVGRLWYGRRIEGVDKKGR